MHSIDEVIALIEASALTDDSGVEFLTPSRLGDAEFDRGLARLQRLSIRPGVFGHFYRQTLEADITDLLPAIRCPTLVLNRTGNLIVPVERCREACEGDRRGEIRGASGNRSSRFLGGGGFVPGRGGGVPHRGKERS
jgi:hypothetical protein